MQSKSQSLPEIDSVTYIDQLGCYKKKFANMTRS